MWLRVGILSGKCLMRRAAWCLTCPPRLHVLTDVRMGRDPPGAVKRRCAGREFEWMRQRMWHHARHEDQLLHRRCIREPLPGRATRTVRRGSAGGSRRVKPGPGRGAGVVLLLVLLLVESEGVRSEGWEATGMSPIFHVLSPHRAVGVVTDQEVACRRTRHVTVAANNPGGSRSRHRNQEVARQEHPWRNGRGAKDLASVWCSPVWYRTVADGPDAHSL